MKMTSNCIIWKMQNDDRETQIFLLEDHSLIKLICDRLTVEEPWEMCCYVQESTGIIYHVYMNGTHNGLEGWGLNIPFVGERKMEAVGSFREVINVDSFELLKKNVTYRKKS